MKRWLLALGTLVVALGLFEIALRVFYPCPWHGYVFRNVQRGFFEFDESLGWRGVPNLRKRMAGADYDVVVHHNADGARTTGVPHAEDKHNVLILGDSYGWGWGVENDELFSEVMMTRDAGLNAYNLSVAGYGTDQELLALRSFMERHPTCKPRDVVLIFSGNDFADNSMPARYGYLKPCFRLKARRVELYNVPVPDLRPDMFVDEEPRPRARWILHESHAYNLLAESIRRVGRSSAPEPAPSDVEMRRQLDVTEELIAWIDRRSRELGAALHVVLMLPGDDARWRDLGERLGRLKIAHSEFHARSWRQTRLWMDTHLNAHGHALLAEHVVSIVTRAAAPRS